MQDSGGRRPPTRPLIRNALGRKLSCCLQDRADAVFGPGRAAVVGSVRRRPGAVRDTAANNPGCGNAISEDCPSSLGDTPGLPRSSGGDNRRDGGAGIPVGGTPTAPADTSMAGRIVHNSGTAVQPYRRLSHLPVPDCQERDLETAVEWVLHPGRRLSERRWKLPHSPTVIVFWGAPISLRNRSVPVHFPNFSASKPPEMLPFYPAINSCHPRSSASGSSRTRRVTRACRLPRSSR